MAGGCQRAGERGQTLPIWTLAVLTALTLMFFSLNYANLIRWQVRAQNAADAAAAAALAAQSNQWNKMTAILYAADVEEWRIRHIMQALIYTTWGDGGCNPNNGSFFYTDNCDAMYAGTQPELYKAINRYTSDIKLLQALAPFGFTAQKADAYNIVRAISSSCSKSIALADCAFTYHVVDYSPRVTTQQVGKDAFYIQVGGFTSPQDSVPVADFEPAQIEITTCATVKPIFNFSFFGPAFNSNTTVIGHAAATNVSATSEWMVPGVTLNPQTNTFFQPAEIYDPQSVFGTPMVLYGTLFQGMSYTSTYPRTNNYKPTSYVSDDFSVMACWWSSVPTLPKVATPTGSTVCTPT